jgi:uncharacterized protein YjbI with pentapeptide repeats
MSYAIQTMNDGIRTTTVAELIAQYRNGLREFIDIYLEDDLDFSGTDFEGSCFDGTWLFGANFRDCKLQNTSFRRCNLKCSDFRGADLRNAVFDAALESSDFAGAILDGAIFTGSTAYGYTMKDGEFPPQ